MISLVITALLGFFIFSFTIVPTIICLLCGIPTTRKLVQNGFIEKRNPIVKKYIFSIILLTIIYIVIALIVISSNSEQTSKGFIIGSVLSLLLSINQLGSTINNLTDYVETQQRYFIKPLDEVLLFLSNIK